MKLTDRIAAMDRSEVDRLLHHALSRLAFVRHTDAASELRRLREPFSHDEYKRADVPMPQDHEVGS
jgi:hypothetical protein